MYAIHFKDETVYAATAQDAWHTILWSDDSAAEKYRAFLVGAKVETESDLRAMLELWCKGTGLGVGVTIVNDVVCGACGAKDEETEQCYCPEESRI